MYWAIKFKTLGRGYHSVYNNKARATKAFNFYNEAYPETYCLIKVTPNQISKNYWNKNIVKFQDSVGWLNVIEGE